MLYFNIRESVETKRRTSKKDEVIVRTWQECQELNRNVLAISNEMRKTWNKNLKTGNTRTPEAEQQRIINRRKNGWFKNPELSKEKIGKSNSLALTKYYETHDIWNKHLTKSDPRVLSYSSKTAGILKDKVKYKDAIGRIRDYNISHHNEKFSLTDIEIIIRDELINMGLKEGKDFFGQVPVKDKHDTKLCRDDWYIIQSDLHIFCDGCFYHDCSVCKKSNRHSAHKRDLRNNHNMKKNNIKFIRFWGHDIHKRLNWCLSKLDI